MDIRQILNQTEKNLMLGKKSTAYSDLTQITQAYEQLYNDHEIEKKKLDNLSSRNTELKSTNENLLIKVVNGETLDWASKPNKQNNTSTSTLDEFLNGIEV